MQILDHTGKQIGVAEVTPDSKTDRAISLTRVILVDGAQLMSPDGPWPARQEHPFSMRDEDGGLYDGCWVESYRQAWMQDASGATIIVEVVVQFTSGPASEAA